MTLMTSSKTVSETTCREMLVVGEQRETRGWRRYISRQREVRGFGQRRTDMVAIVLVDVNVTFRS